MLPITAGVASLDAWAMHWRTVTKERWEAEALYDLRNGGYSRRA